MKNEKLNRTAHIAYLAYEYGMKDNIFTTASSMVYSTLMALVPGITVLYSFFGTFGVLNVFKDQVYHWFSSIFGTHAGEQLVVTIDNYSTQAMSLGVVGLISFLITMIFLINKVWILFNRIYRSNVSSKMTTRVANYIIFIVVTLLFMALYLEFHTRHGHFVTNVLGMKSSRLHTALSFIFSNFIFFVSSFLLIKFVPNVKVKNSSAGISSLFGVVALIITNWIIGSLTDIATNYSVIYGSLAGIFLMIFWFYIFWVILFWSVEVAYVHQFRPDMASYRGLSQAPALQLEEGINILMMIAQNFRDGNGATSLKEMVMALSIPQNRLFGFLELFTHLGYILPVNNARSSYAVARPLEDLRLREVADAIYHIEGIPSDERDSAGDAVARRVREEGIEGLHELTVGNLLERV